MFFSSLNLSSEKETGMELKFKKEKTSLRWRIYELNMLCIGYNFIVVYLLNVTCIISSWINCTNSAPHLAKITTNLGRHRWKKKEKVTQGICLAFWPWPKHGLLKLAHLEQIFFIWKYRDSPLWTKGTSALIFLVEVMNNITYLDSYSF